MQLIPNQQLLDLTGKTIIVTGGTLGIGYGITARLAEAGANVVVANRNVEEANEAVADLVQKGLQVKAVQVDVSKEAEVQNLMAQTIQLFGGLDILVNNAGIYPFEPLAELDSNEFDQVIDINLKGVYLTMKYASEVMIKQGRGGKIINVTSIDAIHPSMVGLAAYDASKHGVWGFTKNAALELAKHQIWVNAIAPGGILTHGVAVMQAAGKPIELARNPEPTPMDVPMGRIGVPDDIGKVALFLASDMSSYMTGTQIVVDGGYLLK
jgi:2-deoxy-D-gluconate 3-dehydrogenase